MLECKPMVVPTPPPPPTLFPLTPPPPLIPFFLFSFLCFSSFSFRFSFSFFFSPLCRRPSVSSPKKSCFGRLLSRMRKECLHHLSLALVYDLCSRSPSRLNVKCSRRSTISAIHSIQYCFCNSRVRHFLTDTTIYFLNFLLLDC